MEHAAYEPAAKELALDAGHLFNLLRGLDSSE